MFVIVGFAFKVSAVPFHTWAPDTYEGAPTPVTAFLSVASKAAGFVALAAAGLRRASSAAPTCTQPLFWVLAALTMTVGNLIALRQTNIVRLFAYSSVAQAGYILAPLAVAGESMAARDRVDQRRSSSTSLIYAAMNLGAFAVIIAVARKTRSGEISSATAACSSTRPASPCVMTMFLFSLAGIPPLGRLVRQVRDLPGAGRRRAPRAGYVLAVIVGVNSVIALFYYARIAQEMWMQPVPDGDRTPVRVPPSLTAALAICVIVTLVLGVAPASSPRSATWPRSPTWLSGPGGVVRLLVASDAGM